MFLNKVLQPYCANVMFSVDVILEMLLPTLLLVSDHEVIPNRSRICLNWHLNKRIKIKIIYTIYK